MFLSPLDLRLNLVLTSRALFVRKTTLHTERVCTKNSTTFAEASGKTRKSDLAVALARKAIQEGSR